MIYRGHLPLRFWLLISGSGLALAQSTVGTEPAVRCSMVELISRSAECAGREVRTVGYAVIRGEESTLYLSETDARERILQNGVILELNGHQVEGKTVDQIADEVSGHYAIVEGSFELLDRKTLPHTSRIFSIRRLERWYSYSESGVPESQRK